jgi:hypothetical protein
MNCVFLGILAILYLNDMALETNIFLLLLLEQPTLTNIISHFILHKTHYAKRNTTNEIHIF